MIALQSTLARPEDLGVTPWYFEDYSTIENSPGPHGERGSYPFYSYVDRELGKSDLTSTRNSSLDSEIPRAPSITTAPRKAYMDLRDAIALLDETCPNQEPSPSLTPRTPRTPLTPYPRNKRARSKSSDNSSNYSNERLSDRSFENTKPPDKEKKRPFLKKIGISKTEDKPFLAKLAPKIIGKPYLEKIGPSRAVERPFLEKIGSSKTLDKFTFDTPRYERKNVVKRETERTSSKDEVLKLTQETIKEDKEKPEMDLVMDKDFSSERRRSGKGYLLKMYSFETEDLESTVQTKDSHRDPLRGNSLDDVLDSGPSSLPPMENTDSIEPLKADLPQRPTSTTELLKCRVTISEEIISTNKGYGPTREASSWSNSPRRILGTKKEIATPKAIKTSRDGLSSTDSIPNSPTKRPISNVSSDQGNTSQDDIDRSMYSPTKTRRQTFDDILDTNGRDDIDMKANKQAQFERRGISSDNLLTKECRSFVAIGHQSKDRFERKRDAASEDSLETSRRNEYSKETFKQLQDKFKYHEIPTETYADFKRRTRGNLQSTIGRTQDRIKTSIISIDTGREIETGTIKSTNEPPQKSDSVGSTKTEEEQSSDVTNELTRSRGGTVRSVLRKQEGIDQASDQEFDGNSSIRRPKRRIFHEPSQETLDLLTELRKVKSMLKTPSWEKDLELDKKPTRLPKRILLTDKEFCLSVERENSIRRPSKVIDTMERTKEEPSMLNLNEEGKKEESGSNGRKMEKREDKSEVKISGPALFEKKCLSLDYADEDKPQKPEVRTISLASTRHLQSEVEETVNYSELALICDSKSYSSDVFNSPSKETNEKERNNDTNNEVSRKLSENHCTEIDIAIPIDQRVRSPKGRVQVQGRTSDLYEIISPRSTPFRMKKRLGKISIEETVKPESFTLGSKVDCRSTVTQKRTKCFPL